MVQWAQQKGNTGDEVWRYIYDRSMKTDGGVDASQAYGDAWVPPGPWSTDDDAD